MPEFFADEHIRNHIHLVRGHRVLLHTDLARFYGVSKNRLLDHAQRFPGDLCFPLERLEVLNFSDEPADSRHRLHAFTEHGAVVAAYMLGTPEAVAMSGPILYAFVQLRQTMMVHDTLVIAAG